ncbi:MAG: carboxypeptidase regulatory-like domain-containing protein [Actinomycetia bacterium]|nr:carboxypeptidase regulatory-like domain-containing protein [Actinomycetes bacterium]
MARIQVGREEGFTVIELVWSSAIMLIVVMGVYSVLTFAAQSTQASTIRVTALNLANQRLEQTRNLAYDNVGVTYSNGTQGNPGGTIPTPEVVDTRFTVTTAVTWARDPDTNRALYKNVHVTVAWTEGRGGHVDVSTSVFGKSNLVNAGDLSIVVRDRDTNEVVPGAQVTVRPQSGADRVVTTGADGEAFYGYLPSGTYSVTIAKDDYIFDSAVLGSVSVQSDLLTSVVAYAQHPSTVNVHVNDGASTALVNAQVRLTSTSGAVLTQYTDGAGVATFANLLVDNYQIVATYTGRTTASGIVNVAVGGQTYDATLSLSPRVGLTVRVIDGSDAVVQGATVNVRGPSPSTSNISGSPQNTASNGEISFGVLADGTYTLTATKSGMTDATPLQVAYDGSSTTVPVLVLGLSQYGTLEIHIFKHNGNPVTQPTWVTVWNSSGYNASFKSSSSTPDVIIVTSLSPGEYSVKPSNGGGIRTVNVQAGQTSIVNVNLPWPW